MIKFKNSIFSFLLLSGLVVFSGWGSEGHRKINEHAPASLPHSMQFLKAGWTILLADHASDADLRKDWDASEYPKHYLNIDDYPEFVQNGKIPMTLDSVVALHGISFVLDKGILPWATMVAFDSLRDCFERMDWEMAGLFAADLGHYVGDGHQPLHLTRNYNGQYSNQYEIHSRYESRLIGKYLDQINYTDDSVSQIQNLTGYIFSYIYYNYKVVDSLLRADSTAHAETGSTSSTTYYSHFWSYSKDFTISLFKRASYSLAGMIYTAWLDAGSPVMPANALDEHFSGSPFRLKCSPNPFSGETVIRFLNRSSGKKFLLEVYNANGSLVTTLCKREFPYGQNEIRWNAAGCRPGIYFIRLKTDENCETARALLFQ
jgi:hypothetical protein